MNEKKTKKTSIGGQALIEGIMMKGPKKAAMALRLSDGSIEIKDVPVKPKKKGFSFSKVPFIRGIFVFFSSMKIGYKCLMYSADKMAEGMEIESEQQSKLDKWLQEKLGDKLMKIVSALGVVLGVAFSVLIFMYLPKLFFGTINDNLLFLKEKTYAHQLVRALVEGLTRISLMLIYLAAVSKMKDMRRVFQYHGAEHKAIFCYEAGQELTPENAMKFTRFHPRCGTSFLFIMMFIGMVAAYLNPLNNPWLRTITGILSLPLIMGLGYELIKLSGKYDNIFTRVLAAPGLWMQRLTTKEPDESMLEVAIAALKEVIPEDESDNW